MSDLTVADRREILVDRLANVVRECIDPFGVYGRLPERRSVWVPVCTLTEVLLARILDPLEGIETETHPQG